MTASRVEFKSGARLRSLPLLTFVTNHYEVFFVLGNCHCISGVYERALNRLILTTLKFSGLRHLAEWPNFSEHSFPNP